MSFVYTYVWAIKISSLFPTAFIFVWVVIHTEKFLEFFFISLTTENVILLILTQETQWNYNSSAVKSLLIIYRGM